MPTLFLVVLDEEEVSELRFFVFFSRRDVSSGPVTCDRIAFLQITIGIVSFNRIFKPTERQSRTVDGQTKIAF